MSALHPVSGLGDLSRLERILGRPERLLPLDEPLEALAGKRVLVEDRRGRAAEGVLGLGAHERGAGRPASAIRCANAALSWQSATVSAAGRNVAARTCSRLRASTSTSCSGWGWTTAAPSAPTTALSSSR
jgi:hypothetical protein